jgi:D-amino peptidase
MLTLEQRVASLLRITQPAHAQSITLRALTLHMLQYTAPVLFERLALKSKLEASVLRCGKVKTACTRLTSPDGAQAEIDAWYVSTLYHQSHQPPEPWRLHATLRELHVQEYSLYTWLLGELAARCGIDVRFNFGPRPFRDNQVVDGYYLTHQVMLESDYFMRPVPAATGRFLSKALTALVPWLQTHPNLDLAAEVALCLQFLGHRALRALRLVRGKRLPSEPHTQAAVLLALSFER